MYVLFLGTTISSLKNLFQNCKYDNDTNSQEVKKRDERER